MMVALRYSCTMPLFADPPAPRPASLLAYPTYLVVQVSKVAQRTLTAALAGHDLTPSHFAVLAAVSDGGALSQQQLADALDLDKSHMVGFIDHLERRGLVARERDPDDRRCYRIGISAAGERLLRTLHEVDRRVQDEVLGELTADERKVLASLLARVLRAHDQRRLATPAIDVPR